MAGALEYEGYEVVGEREPCDIWILHTCTVTAAAEREAMRLVRAARRAGAARIIMSGCVTGVVPWERLCEGGVDSVVNKRTGTCQGTQDGDVLQVANVVAEALVGGGYLRYLPRFTSTRAAVKVQDGCQFRCAYCIVPDARGEPRSRTRSAVLEEVRGLTNVGFREIVLTGVNVACWSEDNLKLTDLIRSVMAEEGVKRLRLSSIEPGTSEHAIVDLMAESGSKLCRTLHYPLQSGDARILKRMRRRYTPEQYEATVLAAVEKVPRLGLGADVITGFPGEDEAAFESTRALIERLPFSNLHVFPYSERPGTPAAEMDGIVPVDVRRARAQQLIALGDAKRAAFAQQFLGTTAEVLLERVDSEGVGRGWTSEYLEAHVSGMSPDAVGRVVSCHVTRVEAGQLWGSGTIL